MPDEKELSDKAKETLANMQVVDMRQAYAEQQEQMLLDFESAQEKKRQDFEAKLEAQKARRDWMMLIITFAAVAAAYWTGWEARHARMEATLAAKESLKAQQQSVDAQIQAMQYEQRPYIRASIGPIKREEGDFGVKLYTFPISFQVSGKTPALDVTVFSGRYDASPAQFKQKDYERLLQNAAPDDLSHQSLAYSDSVFNILAEFKRDQNFFTIFGYVQYKDLFQVTHRTEFCYVMAGGRMGDDLMRVQSNLYRAVPCLDFTPTIT
jgi:hypothetical protein